MLPVFGGRFLHDAGKKSNVQRCRNDKKGNNYGQLLGRPVFGRGEQIGGISLQRYGLLRRMRFVIILHGRSKSIKATTREGTMDFCPDAAPRW